jgi:hypothetical protein
MLSAELFTASGKPILWGWKIVDDSPDKTPANVGAIFAYYAYRRAVYVYCEYLTDTPRQRVGGTRYTWRIEVYGENERAGDGALRRLEGGHQFGTLISALNERKPFESATMPSTRGMHLSGLAKVLGDYLTYHLDFPNYVWNDNPGKDELLRVFSEGVQYYLDTFLPYDYPIIYLGSYWQKNVEERAVVSLPTGSLFDRLKLDEYNLIFEEALSCKPFAAYHIKALQQAAYLDCLDHVPQMNENNIANIAEVVHLLKGIIIDHKVDVPDSLSSLWLSYRYTYGTGKSDIEDAIQFQKRVVDGVIFRQGFSCYGAVSEIIDGTRVTCRCHITMRQKELEYLEKISTGLYRYGLSPSFYVIWDMIPYSFIVDWFIPVGDILSAVDKRRMYDRTYDMSDIWFSLKYEVSDESGSYSAYTRWSSSGLPEFQGYYTLENIGTKSQKTIGFRILDALSLLFR